MLGDREEDGEGVQSRADRRGGDVDGVLIAAYKMHALSIKPAPMTKKVNSAASADGSKM